jgi:hypothetical protein
MGKKSSDDDLTAPASSDGGGEETEASLADMKKVFDTQITDSKTGKKKGYWAVSMETFGMAGGKDGQEDLWLETVEHGIPMLKKYIKEKDVKLAEEQEQAKKKLPFKSWMDLVPLDEFHTTQTNFCKSFLKWSIKDREDIVEGSEEAKLIVNASKARRRMDSYFDWMKDNMAEDLAEHPLTYDSVKKIGKIWCLDSSHMEDGRVAWWFDLNKLDQKAMKTVPPNDHLRYMVWYSHLLMFDSKAQDNGMIFVEDLAKAGFWNCMTMIPMELSAKMDRLTIGVLPLKMKGIYMFGCARWVHLMMGLMKPFMSKKMRSRMITVTESVAPDLQKYLDDLVGRENIPDGFLECKGESPPDALIKRLNKKGKKKEKKESMKNNAGGDE